MARLRDTIDRTPEYVNFIQELKHFHAAKGTTLQAEPVLGGRRLDLYKIFQVVVNSGGFDEVTKNRGWKQVGDIFQFPSTCTNSAYILKGVYIRNLLGWEEEKLWSKDWVPPKELLGPYAHKSSTLAGKAYKTGIKKSTSPVKSASGTLKSSKAYKPTSTSIVDTSAASAANAAANAAAAAAAALIHPLQQQLGNPLLIDFSNNMHLDPTLFPSNQQNQTKTTTAATPPQEILEPQLAIPADQDNTFNEKDRILFALQFGQRSDVEWALDEIVTMSFECPEKLELNESPFLLQLLVSLAQPCLTSHAVDNALPTSASDTLSIMLQDDSSEQPSCTSDTADCATDFSIKDAGMDNGNGNGNEKNASYYADLGTLNIILKVLHILRNFSFLSAYISTLSEHVLVKEILVQALQTSMSTGDVELGRHSMDVLENIAAHLKLESAQDACLDCIYQVVASHDRYLVIGSIRTLTWLTINKQNHASVESSPVMTRISQMLLSDDEELVGTALEYIYQHIRVSSQCRTQFLTSPYANAYIGLLISLLMTKSKYFCTRFIQEDTALPTPLPTTITDGLSNQHPLQQQDNVVPRVPDLTMYQKLDEPFRCLGWLKDKFEVADRTSILSLDDVYLLYEARFGLEKALKMRDFYTVMKIAFPKASTSETSSLLGKSGKSAPVVEGLNIVGIQIKMSILQDRQQVPCKWDRCSLLFDDTFTLQRHVLHDHMTPTTNESYVCSWSHCRIEQNLFETKDALISHLRTHFYNQVGESCYNSPVQSPAPSLSSSPSTPTSNSSSSSMITHSPTIKAMNIVDDSEVQGIALVASHLLNWLSKDPQSTFYFIPYEKELTTAAEQRPKLASHIWSICSNFKSSLSKSATVKIEQPATHYTCSS